MKAIASSIIGLGTLLPLFWFSAFPGAEQYFTTFCANPNAHVATSSPNGFSAGNDDPKLKLCTIVATQPGMALQKAALN